jgi:hypothetical protein
VIRADTARPAQVSQLAAGLRERDLGRERALASLAHVVAERCAPDLDRRAGGPLLDGTIEPDSLVGLELPDELVRPELLGDVLEQLQPRDARRRQGSFFTPHATARLVVDRLTEGWTWPEHPRVCDPACGGGAFLLAAAAALEERGHDRCTIVGDLLWGIDADTVAVATTRATLAIWAGAVAGVPGSVHVVAGDALGSGLDVFGDGVAPFDLVVGNPPFQSQLAASTARTREQARELEERFGDVSRAYADASTLFMVATASMTIPGGRCALILPESFLAARDAAPARSALLERGRLIGLWVPAEAMFSASVRVCVPMFEMGAGPNGSIPRWLGADATATDPFQCDHALDGTTWAELTADLLGVPNVELPTTAVLGTIADATAGFRDQFYGLRPFVRERRAEDEQPIRLVTSGSIDLVNDLSPRRVTTFARSTFTEPVVDRAALQREAPELDRWASRVLVPKVMVATQTRVVEVLVDEMGRAWPSVPVIAVMPAQDRLWHVAAVLASPAVTALSLRRHAGAALTRDAIKLSAKQVLDLPLPGNVDAWDRGAERLRAAAEAARRQDAAGWRRELRAFGVAMCEAYGASDEVQRWWIERVPPFR